MITARTIHRTSQMIKERFTNEHTGHDWWHIWRVWQMAKKIAAFENARIEIVEMAALLHDVADHKLTYRPKDSLRNIQAWIQREGLSNDEIAMISDIIENVSFKGAGMKDNMKSMEGRIVQDADRLDAMGAIGIARTFAYGGSKQRMIYDPSKKPVLHHSFEQYKTSESPTINHFYEKLLRLKDRMHTQTGKKIAEGRHQTMIRFLESFFQEWDANE